MSSGSGNNLVGGRLTGQKIRLETAAGMEMTAWIRPRINQPISGVRAKRTLATTAKEICSTKHLLPGLTNDLARPFQQYLVQL